VKSSCVASRLTRKTVELVTFTHLPLQVRSTGSLTVNLSNMPDLEMDYHISYCGMDGLDHEEEFTGTHAGIAAQIYFLESRGAHTISVDCSGEVEPERIYELGGFCA